MLGKCNGHDRDEKEYKQEEIASKCKAGIYIHLLIFPTFLFDYI